MKRRHVAKEIQALARTMGYEGHGELEVLFSNNLPGMINKMGNEHYYDNKNDVIACALWPTDFGMFVERPTIIVNTIYSNRLQWEKLQPYMIHEIAHLITEETDGHPDFEAYCQVNAIPVWGDDE